MTAIDTAQGQRSIPRGRREVLNLAREVGAAAQPHAARHDREGSFVEEGYAAIRASGYGLLAVPRQLGGGGHGLGNICRAQATLARFCTNTSLAIAMHQHNVLTLAWRWRLGDPAVEHTLRRVADEGLILSSSGAADPGNPGVTATPMEGGLLVSGRKRFVSGAPGADVIATMAAVNDTADRWTTTVLIPTSDPGTVIVDEWDSLGMRGSGSNPVSFTEVFVPEANILDFAPLWSLYGEPEPAARASEGRASQDRASAAARPADSPARPHSGHRFPGLQIALPVIAAVYLGAASAMRDQALRMTAARGIDDPAQQRIAGLLTHEIRTGWWALDRLIEETTDDSLGSDAQFVTTMLAKRQIVLASIRIVELAMELVGSRSYMRSLPFEQALRDVRAGITHPLSPEQTLLEVGRFALEFARRSSV